MSKIDHLDILFIEDDLHFQRALCDRLKILAQKVDVDACVSASEGMLRLYQKRSHNLIILDCNLGNSPSGFSFLEECNRGFPHIPVVIVSGISFEEYLERTENLSRRPPFLAKPFTSSELHKVIDDALSECRKVA